ncbi:lipoprotein insertase outer membrane protein LolB [Candidatus Ichthyocystis hellenicum]|uniref:lipoprotein insertase outer membrane protein LolB n=1 Tax=Candidatus Ichthyocystis hellenicum TaxID=1561003 RepID=UPI000B85E707|nr:lipoprotein insertase outer membrane protein LolB [Candidatus Ichthyocystis hellenicum]
MGVLFQRLSWTCLVFVLSACVSVGNRTFINQPIHSAFDGPEVFSPTIGELSVPIYEISGDITAVSHSGTVTGKIKIVHGSHDDRVVIVSPNNSLIADVVIAGNEIVFRHVNNKPKQVGSLKDWMRTNLGASVPVETVLSWINGRPYSMKNTLPMDTDNKKRECFLESRWLVCIQQPTYAQKNIKRMVQMSVPGMNINLSVDK